MPPRELPKSTTISFTDPYMREALVQYMERWGIDNLGTAVRGLVLESLANTPVQAVVIAQGRRAYQDVQAYAIQRLNQFLFGLRTDCQRFLEEYEAERRDHGSQE